MWKSVSLSGCKRLCKLIVFLFTFVIFPWHQDSFLAPGFLEIIRYCTSPDANLHGLLRYTESFSGTENNPSSTENTHVMLQFQWWQLFPSPVFDSSVLIHSWDKQDVIFCLTRVSGEAVLCSSYVVDEILFSALPIPVCWCLIRGSHYSRAGVLLVS